jgi:uncharacterized protein YndB with AHSA1/START domain
MEEGVAVAFTSREMRASAARAFSALVDVETYPDWLIGAAEIRDASPQRAARSRTSSASGRSAYRTTPKCSRSTTVSCYG